MWDSLHNQDMARKTPSDPRATERAAHLGMALYPEDAALFGALVAESGVTRSGWVRGAIRAAAADPEVARAIAEAGDRTGHGGSRPGAGRPRRLSEQGDMTEQEEAQDTSKEQGL